MIGHAVVWSQRIQVRTEDAKILNLKDDDGGDDGIEEQGCRYGMGFPIDFVARGEGIGVGLGEGLAVEEKPEKTKPYKEAGGIVDLMIGSTEIKNKIIIFYYFIIKNNNILIKLTRLFFLGIEIPWSITVHWNILLFTRVDK
ncbi:hypothetical protein COP2_014166 [Malus domestica]